MKILVADDSTTIQKVIQIAFDGKGAELVMVGSYLELLSEVSKSEYAAIICDANLTGTGAASDFEKIKELKPETPVIFLKGSYDHVDEESLKAAGFTHFLQKPFEADQIVALVGEVTGTKADTPSFSLGVDNDSYADAASSELNDFDQQFGSGAPTLDGDFSLKGPEVSADKGQKAFSDPADDLSLSRMEELTNAGKGGTSPALNLDLMDVADDLVNATVMDSGSPELQVPAETRPRANPAPKSAPKAAPVNIEALAAQMMPAISQKIDAQIKVHMKNALGDNIKNVIREVVSEELRKLIDHKNSLFVDN